MLNAFEIIVCTNICNKHMFWTVFFYLLIKQFFIAVRRENIHLMGSQRIHNLQGLGANGTR